MPVMDGIQATKEIRRMEKANATAGYPPLTPSTEGHTPSDASSADSSVTSADTRASNSPYRSSVIIVALTASSLQSDRVAALAAGCNDFLTKPVSLLWLNNKIIEWGSIKALQMWADIKPDAMITGQAAQARNIADRLHVPPKGRKTPSPTRRSTSVLEDNAAALALASSAGTIMQRLSGQFSPSSTFGTPGGPQSVSVDSHPPVTQSTLDSISSMPDVLGSASVLSRISESADPSDGGKVFFFLFFFANRFSLSRQWCDRFGILCYIHINCPCRYRYTESRDTGQAIIRLLVGTSTTLRVAVIDPLRTSIC